MPHRVPARDGEGVEGTGECDCERGDAQKGKAHRAEARAEHGAAKDTAPADAVEKEGGGDIAGEGGGGDEERVLRRGGVMWAGSGPRKEVGGGALRFRTWYFDTWNPTASKISVIHTRSP